MGDELGGMSMEVEDRLESSDRRGQKRNGTDDENKEPTSSYSENEEVDGAKKMIKGNGWETGVYWKESDPNECFGMQIAGVKSLRSEDPISSDNGSDSFNRPVQISARTLSSPLPSNSLELDSSSQEMLRKHQPILQEEGRVDSLNPDSQSVSYCGMLSCGKRCSRSDLKKASPAVLMYCEFEFALQKTSVPEDFFVCLQCFKKAEKVHKKSVLNFSNEGINRKGVLIGKQNPPDSSVTFSVKKLNRAIKQALSTCKVTSHLKKCRNLAKQEIQNLGRDFDDLDECMQTTSAQIVDVYFNYKKVFSENYTNYITREVEIDSDTGKVTKKRPFRPKRRLNNACPIQLLEEIIYLDREPEVEFVAPSLPTQRKKLLPCPETILRPVPNYWECVIALRKSCWIPGQFIGILDNESETEPKCTVRFNGVSVSSVEEQQEQVPLKYVAYNKMIDHVLPWKSNQARIRIVARLSSAQRKCDCSKKTPHYYPGLIVPSTGLNSVETPVSKYLVCFDDGRFANVAHADVRLMYLGNLNTFLETIVEKKNNPEMNEFLERLITGESEWNLRPNCTGDTVIAWRNDKWRIARVTNVDREMVTVEFDGFKLANRRERIFRGSPRFYTVFKYYAAKYYGPPQKSVWRLHDQVKEADNLLGFEGKIKKCKIPNAQKRKFAKPKSPKKHNCNNSNCAVEYNVNGRITKMSPLARPLCFGWTYKSEGCVYIAPCGRKVRTYRQLLEYVEETGSSPNLDWFSFQPGINYLHYFQHERGTDCNEILDDISRGTEKLPISTINTVDAHCPMPSFTYTPECVISDDVKNMKKDFFRTCCDCTDGCLDRQKCACLKLTMDKFAQLNLLAEASPEAREDALKTAGYNNRKLLPSKTLGLGVLYECNKNCTCKANLCSNRVVQNGYQWPLQVFKTKNKGWAVRTLCDIPQGSYISKYAGELKTEKMANEHGAEFGDEYLLDLRLIDEFPEDCKEFPEDQLRFVIEPKFIGNISRFFNHSCLPNMFTQTVFVETHDVRFPTVALFTSENVMAGAELTWDYNYEVGSVEGKEMKCHCGAEECRGQLL